MTYEENPYFFKKILNFLMIVVDSGRLWCYYIAIAVKKANIMIILTGEYDHQVDAKNRIRMPAKLKGNEEKLYFANGTDGCIFVFYEEIINAKLEALASVKLTDTEKQRGLRFFTRSVKPVDMDSQGRLVIPSEFVTYANIKKDIKICGCGTRIEIWAKEVFDEYNSNGAGYDASISILDF